ncbi:hypothetical protein EYB26_002160 [Talaromyces marneffei]|uniref:Ubiquitin-like-specific protease 1 n=2 Tax=Talaromyces marneffei PM1 TaxID=1077442 RepID=A0A093V8W3_TALMA|nr:uncharacterized protein EYB26_002160 [Talaromyces marneffei]QGA14505.1 hypothetical protein EYB26_002160 [Talaromyces marneffei]
MEGDSDIQMVDAPEASPRSLGAFLSGSQETYPTPIYVSYLEKYSRVNEPASASLRPPCIHSNTYKPIREMLPHIPSQLAKSRSSTITAPVTRGPNYFNTPKGSMISFRNSRTRAVRYLGEQNSSRRFSPSELRRSRSQQTNYTPDPLKKTWNFANDFRVVNREARLERARAALEASLGGMSNRPGKRFITDVDESELEPKRPRILETQGTAMDPTPGKLPVRMPGAFPESPVHAPVETHPLSLPAAQNAAARNSLAIDGLNIYARIRRITGVVRGAHRALKQGIKVSAQFVTTVGQRIRATHVPIPTVIVEEHQETQETYESATSASSDQLQADLTAHTQSLPPRRYAVPVVDPSAQLQAELFDHTSHISPPSTIVTAPTPRTISANVMAQDQPSIQEATMSKPRATLLEAQPTTSATSVSEVQATPTLTSQPTPTITVQPTSTSFVVEPFVDVDVDEDLNVRRMREHFDRLRGGRPRPEPSPYRQAYLDRLFERPAPVTPADTSLDAEVTNSELAQEREEEIEDTPSVSEQEHPTDDEQDTTQVEEIQIAEEQAEEQDVGVQTAEENNAMDPAIPPDDDEEYDPNAYYPGVPPLMPERRFIFNAEFRRKAAAKAEAERRAAAAREAVEAPVREYVAALEALEVAKAKQVRDALRPILRRRRGDNPNQPQIETMIQETVNQLAATTVHDEVPATIRPERHVHWPDEDEGINFGTVISACAWFRTHWPPSKLTQGPEPRDRAGYEAYEDDIRRREEQWERQQQEQVVQRREQALGRVGVPDGQSAVRSLTPEWEQRLLSAMRSSPREILVRTPDADLTKEKLQTCWTPLAWLNDEVINGHLTYTVDYLRRQANNLGRNDAPRYHAFNSFFYKNLRDSGYHSVRRWAHRAKIGGSALLNVDTVFIPVHEGAHWTLLVVSPKMRTIEYFDSLGGNADSFVENTKRWLQGELGDAYNESEWLFLNTESPQQDNGSDCGVFLLTSAKAIALGLKPTVYGPRDINLIRRKIVAELMNGGLSGDFDPRGSSGIALL